MINDTRILPVIGRKLLSAFRGADIELVFTFPAISLDDVFFSLCDGDEIQLVVASSELAALDAAHAFWEISGQAVAVVLDAEFCLPGAFGFIEQAVKRRSRIVFVFVFVGELSKLRADTLKVIGVQWQEYAEERFAIETLDVGPLVLFVHQCENLEFRSPRKVPELLQEAIASVSADDVDADMAAGGSWFIVLPEVNAPSRAHSESVAVSLGIPTVTTQGHDNFAQRHPELWLGRLGFAPSRNVVELLGETQIEQTRLLMTEPSTLPHWVRATPFLLLEGSVARPQDSIASSRISTGVLVGQDEVLKRSELVSIVEDVMRLALDALFIADAGASHRVVASAVANSGRAALMTVELTPMGWSLRAALGAALAQPGRLLVPVLGDGAGLIQAMDLAILAKNQVPALVVLAVNGTLGHRVTGTPVGDASQIPAVDWALIGQALGCSGPALSREFSDDKLKIWIARALAERRPVLIPVDTRNGTLSDYAIPSGIAALDS